MSTKTYRAVSAFVQDNTRYDKGVILQLTDKQAAYLTQGGFIELLPAKPAVETAADADADADADAGEADTDANPRNKKGARA